LGKGNTHYPARKNKKKPVGNPQTFEGGKSQSFPPLKHAAESICGRFRRPWECPFLSTVAQGLARSCVKYRNVMAQTSPCRERGTSSEHFSLIPRNTNRVENSKRGRTTTLPSPLSLACFLELRGWICLKKKAKKSRIFKSENSAATWVHFPDHKGCPGDARFGTPLH